jgi:enoyl-CoA hydratase/carnithine racemase
MPRLIGRARSLELILGGIDLDAVTAERWGYLNRALPPEQIDEFVHSMASRIAASSPDAVRLTRVLVAGAEDRPVEEGLREESFSLQRLMASDDSRASIRRFLEIGGETRDGEKRLDELLAEVIRTSATV